MARRIHRGELALIDQIRSRTSVGTPTLRLGIGDDCAILRTPRGQELLVTTDFSLEGRHFLRRTHPPESIGHRALARGLSDLAAMGARPVAAFLSLALPRSVARNRNWLNRFLDGLLGLAQRWGVPLAGGDTSESPTDHVLADIVLLGTAPAGRGLRRSGARPRDLLYVSGSLGGAAAELQALLRSRTSRPHKPRIPFTEVAHPHLFPQPRLNVGRALLTRRLASAAIDLSDGLSTDLNHLCEASHVAAEVHETSLPLHALTHTLLQNHAARLRAALHGGEDYELLFTAPRTAVVPRSIAGVPMTCIGRIVRHTPGTPRVTLVAPDNRRSALKPEGWQHLT